MHTTGFWNNPVRRKWLPISSVPVPWRLWQIYRNCNRHNTEPHRPSVETAESASTATVPGSLPPAGSSPASITIIFLIFLEHPSMTFTLSVPHNSSAMQLLPHKDLHFIKVLPCPRQYYNTSAKCTFKRLKITAPNPNNTTVTIQKYIVEKKSWKNHSFS